MNKVKLDQEVVNNLRRAARNIEVLLKTIDENKISTKEELIAIEEVRAILASKSQGGKQKEVKNLILKYGGNKLTDIDQAYYQGLLKEAEGL